MDIVGRSLFGSRYLRSALNVQFHVLPKWTLITCLVRLFTQQPFAMSHHQHHRHHPHHHHYHYIIIIIILILILITIIRHVIRIFRHPFAPYPTVRWKWQVRASIGTAKRHSGVCANTDRVFFPPHDVWVRQYIPPNGYLKWTKWWAIMDIVGCSLFGSRYFRSEYPVPCPPHVLRSAFALSDPPRPLWHNHLSCHPFSSRISLW